MGFQRNNPKSKGNLNLNHLKKQDSYSKDFYKEEVILNNSLEQKNKIIAIYKRNKNNKKDFIVDFSNEGLEIKSTDLDDLQSLIVRDDEEDNYYVFGDDDDN